jgi:hypothetical protein
MHLYLAVDCRTPDCNMTHVLKYLGEKGEVPEFAPVSVPVPLWLHCLKCHLNHDYSSCDFRKIERAEAPPSDFRDTI